ncbi:hypothetical protein GCK72_022478 [Caenorhabditis remanei]|uniref:C2H2-type domain-containing protein n=1 Tax=Caenorhabditis remanei TaxID=31234 RepID=A0A6A5FTW4_CAERE|nr:hypothetical protein GCK72_022478 [Caenorhabditis remanei]KAF1746027.1 hypothetical protein GCK72_022478 [Caenorhabditis remanei]
MQPIKHSIASLLAPTVLQANHQTVTSQPVINGYSIAALLAPTVPHVNNQLVNCQQVVNDISERNQESDEQFYERMRSRCLAILAARDYDLSGLDWPPGLTQQLFLVQLIAGAHKNEVMKNEKLETENQVSEAQKYRCVYCGGEFNDQKRFSRHLRKHTDIRPFLCEICPSTFRNNYDLTKHRKSHIARQHHCVACKFRFKTSSELESHMNAYKDLHGTKNPITKRFDCKRCGRSFTRLSSLKYHMQHSRVCREESVKGVLNTVNIAT